MTSLEEQLKAMGLQKGSDREKRLPTPKWLNPGDAHAIVVTGDWFIEAQIDINGTWNPLYLVETDEPNPAKPGKNKWKKISSATTPEGNYMALEQTIVPGKLIAPAGNLAAGADVLFSFGAQEEKDALLDAMVEFGDILKPGVGLKKVFTRKDGSKRRWTVKLAHPKEG